MLIAGLIITVALGAWAVAAEIGRRKLDGSYEKLLLKAEAEKERLRRVISETEFARQTAISDLDKVKSELKEKEAEAAAFALDSETERMAVADRLHDDTLSSLSTVIRALQKAIKTDDDAVARGIIFDALGDLEDVAVDIREIMEVLKPYTLLHFGLHFALETSAQREVEHIDGTQLTSLTTDLDDAEPNLGFVEKVLLFKMIKSGIKFLVDRNSGNNIAISSRYNANGSKLSFVINELEATGYGNGVGSNYDFNHGGDESTDLVERVASASFKTNRFLNIVKHNAAIIGATVQVEESRFSSSALGIKIVMPVNQALNVMA